MLNKVLLFFGLYYKYDRLWVTKRLEKVFWIVIIYLAIRNFFLNQM